MPFEMPEVDIPDVHFTSNDQRRVFSERYCIPTPTGRETPEQTVWRVSAFLAGLPETYIIKSGWVNMTNHRLKKACRKALDYYHLMATMSFLPNSPTFFGAGTEMPNLSACFVLPISDDMGTEEDGIFSTLRHATLIQQTGGGVGFSFSRLREAGSLVHKSFGLASGPVSFLRAYDAAFSAIQQGGKRRCANMGVLRVDHPDIREFITCKDVEGHISSFNISVAITDEFMDALEKGFNYQLISPSTGEVVGQESAHDIMKLIAKQATKNGEPGLLFIDAAERQNPVPDQGAYEATNPCGEQWLLPYESCNLGAINLRNVVHDVEGELKIDWDRLREVVELGVSFLNDVVDRNGFVPAVPQLRDAALANRRIGLGIMGLADLLILLRVPYWSQAGREVAAQLMEFIRYHAMLASIELAKETAPFPNWPDSALNPASPNYNFNPPTPAPAVTPTGSSLGRPTLDWQYLIGQLAEHGIANSTTVTVAPTGTRSTIAGLEGYGCEPVFAFAYQRHVVDNTTIGDNRWSMNLASPLLDQAMGDANLSMANRQAVIDLLADGLSMSEISADHVDLPQWLVDVFKASGDLTWKEHVSMQSVLQLYVDSSISKTINFPAGTNEQEVMEAYQYAYEVGCKGITVYVAGSRDLEVLQVGTSDEPPACEPNEDGVCMICD